MSHENFKHKLLQYFYAELSEKDRAEFETHLAGCEECRKELNSLKSISLELDRGFEKARIPAGVLERIREAAEAKTDKGLLYYLWPRPLAARIAVSFAAAALLIFVVRAGIERWNYRPPTGLVAVSVTDQIDLIEQDLSMDTPSSSETADDLGIAALSTDLEPADEIIDSLDEDIGEVEEISGGIFEL